MRTRLLTAFGAATVLAITAIAPASAQAGSSTPQAAQAVAQLADDCSVLDTSPNQVSIGLKPVTVQFDVGTDCDDEEHKIEWALRGDHFPTSQVSWFGACTYLYSGPDIYTCPDGRAKLDVIGTGTFKGNRMAGAQDVHVSAFDDEDGDDQPDVAEGSADGKSSITLLRRTTWGTTLNAAPEPRRKGQTLNITGQVSRANWNTGRYEKFGAYVKLQFRADGEEKFRSVRTVWDNGAVAETKVKATRSGTFRYWYPGDGTHAPSASKGDHVKVLRAR